MCNCRSKLTQGYNPVRTLANPVRAPAPAAPRVAPAPAPAPAAPRVAPAARPVVRRAVSAPAVSAPAPAPAPAPAVSAPARATGPIDSADYWGPILWGLLHTVAEHISEKSGTNVTQLVQYVMEQLPFMLPCSDCQNHAKIYMSENVFDAKGKVGLELKKYTVNYLLIFHNAVRARQGKPIEVSSPEATAILYGGYKSPEIIEENLMIMYKAFNVGISDNIVDARAFGQFNSQFRKLVLNSRLFW